MPKPIPPYVCAEMTKLKDDLRVLREEKSSNAQIHAASKVYGDKFLAIARAEIGLSGFRHAIWTLRANQDALISHRKNFNYFCAQQLLGTLVETPVQAATLMLLSDQSGSSGRDFLQPVEYEMPTAMAILATAGLPITDVATVLADPIRQPFAFSTSEPNKYLADIPIEDFVFEKAKGGTINMKTNMHFEMWIIGYLLNQSLVTLPEFDGMGDLQAKAEVWLNEYRAHYAAGRIHAETGSNYRWIHERLLVAYARALPVGSVPQLAAKEVFDATLRSEASSYLDGRSLMAASRNSTFVEGLLPTLVGADQAAPDPSWFEFHPMLIGNPDDPTTNPYIPPTDLSDIAHHQGILTAEEVLFEAFVPVVTGPTDYLHTRTKWTWRHKPRRAGVHVSSWTWPVSRHVLNRHPSNPVFGVTTVLTDERYYYFSLTSGMQRNASSPDYAPVTYQEFLDGESDGRSFFDNLSNSNTEWHYQHDNVLMLVTDEANRINSIFTHQSVGGSGGYDKFDYAYADEIDATDPNWLFARYGEVYMVLWLSGTRTLLTRWVRSYYDEVQGFHREMTRTNFGQVEGTVDGDGRGAGILAAYHSGQFATLADLKAEMLANASAAFDASTQTLTATMPVAVREAPDAVEYRELDLQHRAWALPVGPELVDGEGWLVQNGWTLSEGTFAFAFDVASGNRIEQNIAINTDTTYRVAFDILLTSGEIVVNLGESRHFIEESGSFEVDLTPTGAHSQIRFVPTDFPAVGEISNISVKAVERGGQRRQRLVGEDWIEWVEPTATNYTLHGGATAFTRADFNFGFERKPRILMDPLSDVPEFIGEIAVTTRPSFAVYCATGLTAGAWLELERS